MKSKLFIVAVIAILASLFGASSAVLAAQPVESSSAQECAGEMVTGDTVFVYMNDETGACRPFLVYSETYRRLSYSMPAVYPPSIKTKHYDPRFSGWPVVIQVGGPDTIGEHVVMQVQKDGQLVERVYRRFLDSVSETEYALSQRFVR